MPAGTGGQVQTLKMPQPHDHGTGLLNPLDTAGWASLSAAVASAPGPAQLKLSPRKPGGLTAAFQAAQGRQPQPGAQQVQGISLCCSWISRWL